MLVLVVNAGSSSLKYQLIDMSNEQVVAKGIAERIGGEDSSLTHETTGKQKIKRKPISRIIRLQCAWYSML